MKQRSLPFLILLVSLLAGLAISGTRQKNYVTVNSGPKVFEEFLQDSFEIARSEKLNVSTEIRHLDHESLLGEVDPYVQYESKSQRQRLKAALALRFNQSLKMHLRQLETLKAEALTRFSNQWTLSLEQKQRLEEGEITFRILEQKPVGDAVEITLQMFPELTDNDVRARLTLSLKRSEFGLKIHDLRFQGISLRRSLNEEVLSFRHRPGVLLDRLLQRGLVTEGLLSDYARALEAT